MFVYVGWIHTKWTFPVNIKEFKIPEIFVALDDSIHNTSITSDESKGMILLRLEKTASITAHGSSFQDVFERKDSAQNNIHIIKELLDHHYL